MPNGRLANPDCSLGTDPRADPRMIEAFAPFGIDALLPELPVTVDSPLDDRLAFSAETEEMISTVFEAFGQAVPIAEGVTTTTVTIPGGDGQDLTLYVSRPDTAVALPCAVQVHDARQARSGVRSADIQRQVFAIAARDCDGRGCHSFADRRCLPECVQYRAHHFFFGLGGEGQPIVEWRVDGHRQIRQHGVNAERG